MKKRKYLSKKEVEALIHASQQQDGSLRDYCMLLMCFIHGLRVSEKRGKTLYPLCMIAIYSTDTKKGWTGFRRSEE